MTKFSAFTPRRGTITVVLLLGALLGGVASIAQEPEMTPAMQAQLAKMGAEDRQMILSYTPELRQKFFACHLFFRGQPGVSPLLLPGAIQ